MAKITGPLPLSTQPANAAQLLARTYQRTSWDDGATTWDDDATNWDRSRRGPSRVALNHPGITPTTPRQNDARAVTALWTAQYNQLAGWKRTRWTACAIPRGMGGLQLYLQCATQQNTDIGTQPISPCSRRALDPNASPFDFTP
jgi:hypothetical protein